MTLKGLSNLLKNARRYMMTIHLSTIIVSAAKLRVMTSGLAGLMLL